MTHRYHAQLVREPQRVKTTSSGGRGDDPGARPHLEWRCDMPDATCSIEGCDRRARCRGYCNKHYERWRLGRGPRPLRKPCLVEGCSQTALARGCCPKHYERWRKRGDPETLDRPTYGSKRRISKAGYVMVFESDHPLAYAYGYVYEHRKVAWDAGMLIGPGDHVHHRNEDKTDNRLGNLQVIQAIDHAKHHLGARGYVTNQHGTWSLHARGQQQLDMDMQPT